jgi:hypothetical protein
VLREGEEATEATSAISPRTAGRFKVPRKVVILDEIPKGATGKLQRIGLAEKLGLGLVEGILTMKICIFGAGAIGGYMGAKLAQAGADVSLVARGPHLAAMKENGLTPDRGGRAHDGAVTASDNPPIWGRRIT